MQFWICIHQTCRLSIDFDVAGTVSTEAFVAGLGSLDPYDLDSKENEDFLVTKTARMCKPNLMTSECSIC